MGGGDNQGKTSCTAELSASAPQTLCWNTNDKQQNNSNGETGDSVASATSCNKPVRATKEAHAFRVTHPSASKKKVNL